MFKNGEKMLKKIDRKNLYLTVFLFIVFAFLVYLFPYSGDDLPWGSQIGLDRLKNGFDNYNGRYAGNLLVIVLTRSEFLNILVMASSFVCVCLFPKIFSSTKSILPYLFGTALFLLIPIPMLEQSVVWTSGFSNYVPPILLIFLYFIIIKDLFEKNTPKKFHWVTYLVVAVIGFSSSLFMENVTLYNVAISVLIIAFTIYKFKKVFLINLTHLISGIIGLCVMFSNSAYSTIASGEDSYRNTGLNEGLRDTVFGQSRIIFDNFIEKNYLLLIIFSLLCAVVYFMYAKAKTNKKYNTLGFITLSLNFLLLFILFQKNKYTSWAFNISNKNYNDITTLIFVLISVLYFVSAAVILLLCIKSESVKAKAFFLLISIPILIAPLAIVTPIGPRCFFPPFFLLIALCVLIFSYIQENLNFNKAIKSSIATVSIAYILATLIFFTTIFSTIHIYDTKRLDYIKRQVEAGYTTVKVCKLPFANFVWFNDPSTEPWGTYYKLFHGIDNDIEFEFLTFTKFNEWAKTFDKKDVNK